MHASGWVRDFAAGLAHVCALAAIALCLHSGAASAQFLLAEPPTAPSSVEVARARESFKNGLENGKAGRWPEAVLAFDEAYRLSGNPVALLNLAAALRESGRAAEARACARALEARHAAQLDAETRLRAEEIYRSVTAVIALHSVPENTVVTLDGQVQTGLETRFELDPGPHHVRLSEAGHRPFEWTGFVRAAEVHDLTYLPQPSLAPPPAVGPATQLSATRQEPKALSPRTRTRMPRWAVGLLVSAATLALGAGIAIPLALNNQAMDAPAGVDATYPLK